VERLDQAGRRPAVIDATPAFDGIIFRSDLGWVLMTAGYPLLRLLFVIVKRSGEGSLLHRSNEGKERP